MYLISVDGLVEDFQTDVFDKAVQHESSICHKTQGHDVYYDAELASTCYSKHIQSTGAEHYHNNHNLS